MQVLGHKTEGISKAFFFHSLVSGKVQFSVQDLGVRDSWTDW